MHFQFITEDNIKLISVGNRLQAVDIPDIGRTEAVETTETSMLNVYVNSSLLKLI